MTGRAGSSIFATLDPPDLAFPREPDVVPTVRVNGCDFFYQLQGQGPALVFIHGEIHGLEYWEHQLPEFARDHSCLAYNRRGHAGTELTSYGFSLVNQTRDLAQLIEHFRLERPVLIAVAFGTTIAANYAIAYPGRVKAMVMAAWSELHEAMAYFHRWEQYNAQAAEVLEKNGREALMALLREQGGKTIYRVIPVDSPVREQVIRMFASHPLEEYRRGMLEFGSSVPDLVPELRKLELPVLGLCGADDPYPDQPEVLAGMKNFREAPSIPGAARFVHWERPREFNAAVREFLATLP